VTADFAVHMIFDAVQFWLKRSSFQAGYHNKL
jgi:hypothetical protein